MTVIWLIIWLLNDTPQPQMWNDWAIALIICLVLDFLSIGSVFR